MFEKVQGEAGKIYALTKPLQNYGLYDLAVIENAHYGLLALNLDTIEQINIVMRSLVPDIRLEIYNTFEKLTEKGKDGIQFEVITIRGEARTPLLYESAGIKKLISICSNLVACYNRESYCLVVDELDSGIYEYLLGECLEVMQEKAKGQLIFTSHNLRPLEVLQNEFLIYTTVNPNNRYIKSVYIKNMDYSGRNGIVVNYIRDHSKTVR